MTMFFKYNVVKYIDSYRGRKHMTIDGILMGYARCEQYSLNSTVSDYMEYIEEEPFYIPPTLQEIKTQVKASTLNPKFILFSAPGATGKSSLAKYIAYKNRAIYWDLSKVKIGTNSFAGSILSAVGAPKYSSFINDLNEAKALLVIDAFDEAEVISGRKMISSFLSEIDMNLMEQTSASVFLLARTETAQYIASYCAESGISVVHYEIGFFQESSAKSFITKKALGANKAPTPADEECINTYYDTIRKNISDEESTSFLGYAPVLQAIAKHIQIAPNRARMISELLHQKDCASIIITIMQDLLAREKEEKVIPAFIERCQEEHPEFSNWNIVYSQEEQLVRIVQYLLFESTDYSNYVIDEMPPQLVNDYQELLNAFLPQHPFVRNAFKDGKTEGYLDFTGPAFRDYTLSMIIIDKAHSELASMYFEEAHGQSHFPSQIFFDCYKTLMDNKVYSNHLAYVYDSFKAKATAMERPYMECTEIPASEDQEAEYSVVFGMIQEKGADKKDDVIMEMEVISAEIVFEQVTNVSIVTPSITIRIGNRGIDARIYNSSIIAKSIMFDTRVISIESFLPEGCLLVSRESIGGSSPTIEIVRSDNLRISAPNINDYYRVIPYKYDFEDVDTTDATKFIHALRCILVEFRTHKKDMLAKTAERIDYVVVGGSKLKQRVLNFLKETGIIYPESHLYKVNEVRMQEKGISYAALSRMDQQILEPVFKEYLGWQHLNSD